MDPPLEWRSAGKSARRPADTAGVPFSPAYELTPRMLRQLKAIEQTTGFLEAVRLRSDWISEVRGKAYVQEALASLQIEGSSLTLDEAFSLARGAPEEELRDSERQIDLRQR